MGSTQHHLSHILTKECLTRIESFGKQWDILLGSWLGLFKNIHAVKDKKKTKNKRVNYGDGQLNDESAKSKNEE